VLRGTSCKVGDVLPVKLSQAVLISQSRRHGVPGDPEARIPAIAFVHEDGANLQQFPAALDAERPHVYFFPKEKLPRLDRRGQIQVDYRDGWKEALAGKPINLTFRLLHDPSSDMHREAIDELYRKRGTRTIADLVDALVEPPGRPQWYEVQQFVERVLNTLGDKDGDLHDPVLAALGGLPGGRYDPAFRLSRILCHGDGKRALADLKKLLGDPKSRISRAGVVWGMHNLDSEAGLDYLFELLLADTPQSLESFRAMMHNEQMIAVPMVRRARVQELAVPRLQKILKDGSLSTEQKRWARFREYFHYLTNPLGSNEIAAGPQFYRGQNHPAPKSFPDWDRLVYESQNDPEHLLKADLVEGRKLLRALASKPDPAWKVDPPILQSLMHEYGDPEMVRQTRKPADRVVRYRDTHSANFHRTGYAAFMKMFRGTRKLSDAYWARVAALFADYPNEYFGELTDLIASKEEGLRYFAIEQLKSHFFWDFDLDPKDFRPVTERKLKTVEPLLEDMKKGDMLHRRAVVLRHFGVELKGPPGKAWLPALEKAALSWNQVVKLNALHVLGTLEENAELTLAANYPVVQRKEVMDDIRKRRRDAAKGAGPLPAARIRGLWKDLGDDRATAYAAMAALARTPASTVPFLRKVLKEPDRDQPVEAKRCARLVADLGSDNVKARAAAAEALKTLGQGTVLHLRDAASKAGDPDTRRRIEALIASLRHENARYHRLVRGIQVLEYSPGAEARALLEELAAGPPDLPITHEARQAMERLRRYWRW
jgi:hypothetical protein